MGSHSLHERDVERARLLHQHARLLDLNADVEQARDDLRAAFARFQAAVAARDAVADRLVALIRGAA